MKKKTKLKLKFKESKLNEFKNENQKPILLLKFFFLNNERFSHSVNYNINLVIEL